MPKQSVRTGPSDDDTWDTEVDYEDQFKVRGVGSNARRLDITQGIFYLGPVKYFFTGGNVSLVGVADGTYDLVLDTLNNVSLVAVGAEAADQFSLYRCVILSNHCLSATDIRVGQVKPASGGGGDLYTNSDPTPADIGGIPAGSTFNLQTMQQMWDVLLYPYQYPAFTSFLIQGQASSLEVGQAIPAGVVFNWATINDPNIVPNSLVIRDMTLAVDLAIGLANDGTEPVIMPGPITRITPGLHQFRIQGQHTYPGVFNRLANYNWYWKLFYGDSANAGPLSEAQIETLTNSVLTATYVGTYAFPATGGAPTYKYICFPTSFGTPSSFTDPSTGFVIPMQAQYIVALTNAYGHTANYYVYRTTNAMAGAISIQVS
jgi:hypothetical protein